MKYVIKSLIFIAFCLFLGQITACKPPNELIEIGNQLMRIDSISDFSTNHTPLSILPIFNTLNIFSAIIS